MSCCNKSLLVGCLGVLAAGVGLSVWSGCPTKQSEADLGLAKCAAKGYFNGCAHLWAPDARQMEARGEELLRQWNTSSTALDEGFLARFPQGLDHLGVPTPNEGCLTAGPLRTHYHNLISKISSFLGNSTSVASAHAASKFRSLARTAARALSCNTADDDFLQARDACTHGSRTPSFLYWVGKYANKAAATCKKGFCDIRNATCSAITQAAQKTNAVYNQLAKFV